MDVHPVSRTAARTTSSGLTFSEEGLPQDALLWGYIDGDEAAMVQFEYPDDDVKWEERFIDIFEIRVHDEYRGQGLAVQMIDEVIRRHPAPKLNLDQGTVAAMAVMDAWFRFRGLVPDWVQSGVGVMYRLAAHAAGACSGSRDA